MKKLRIIINNCSVNDIRKILPKPYLKSLEGYIKASGRNWMNKKYNENIELISMHIPKTGGSSIQWNLRAYYGVRLLYAYGGVSAQVDFYNNRYSKIPWRKTAVHGHFTSFSHMKTFYPNAKLITWVRNPVDRVISLYFHFKRTKFRGNKTHKYMLDNDLSLLEFAEDKKCYGEVHAYEKYFENIEFDDFFFIGLLENYDSHIEKLAEALGWKACGKFHENMASNKPQISPDDRSELALILSDEIAIYEQLKHQIIDKFGE